MGFLFIKPEDSKKDIHIFPAYCVKDKEYHTFNDEDFENNIDWIEDIINNQDKIKDVDSDSNEAICHGVGTTLADMGVVNNNNKRYCKTIDKAVDYSAILKKKKFKVCGNCVKRFYKDEDDN